MAQKEPEKLYYTISEVSRITDLPASVLRFWESEFAGLRPPKNRAGKRVYRQKDIDRIFEIKKLLYEDRFTIEGARRFLQEKSTIAPFTTVPLQTIRRKGEIPAEELRRGLQDILKLLSN